MTLTLRTHEQIQEYLVHPLRLIPLKKAAASEKLRLQGQKTYAQALRTDAEINKILLRAAFGHNAFKGRLGKHLQAVGEYRKSRITKAEAQELGELLTAGGQRLRFAIQLDPDQLIGLTDEEKHTIIHKFKQITTYIHSKGTVLTRFRGWRIKQT